MNNIELVAKLKDVALNYKTLYIMGCIGSPMTTANKVRYCNNHTYNRDPKRQELIKAASEDTFGFDCVCLIKSLLWGWNGAKDRVYGGATYTSNDVPDIGADTMIKRCEGVSTDFSRIEIGEAVWMPGHIGVYIGDGLAVECTPIWDDGVQITACNCDKAGYHRRNWTKHGKLPYIEYINAITCTVELPVLKRGDKGYAVKTLQRLLKALGYKGNYGLALAIDGSFGPSTEKAIKAYKADNKLPNDSYCDGETWAKLLA